MLKIDKYPFGLALGALAPILGIVLYYYAKFRSGSVGLGEFIEYFFKTPALLTSVGSLSLIINIVLFTVYINGRKDKTAVGIVTMTARYG